MKDMIHFWTGYSGIQVELEGISCNLILLKDGHEFNRNNIQFVLDQIEYKFDHPDFIRNIYLYIDVYLDIQ
jgi:hypothetical protein